MGRIARGLAGWLLVLALWVAPMVLTVTHGPAATGEDAWSADAATHGHAHATSVADDDDGARHDAGDHEHQVLALLPVGSGLASPASAQARHRRRRLTARSTRDGPDRPPRPTSA